MSATNGPASERSDKWAVPPIPVWRRIHIEPEDPEVEPAQRSPQYGWTDEDFGWTSNPRPSKAWWPLGYLPTDPRLSRAWWR